MSRAAPGLLLSAEEVVLIRRAIWTERGRCVQAGLRHLDYDAIDEALLTYLKVVAARDGPPG